MNGQGSQLTCWLCKFSTITQKGLHTHLHKVHNIKLEKNREKNRQPAKPTRQRRRMIPVKRENFDRYSAPFMCAICKVYFTETKDDLLRHMQFDHPHVQETRFQPYQIPHRMPYHPNGYPYQYVGNGVPQMAYQVNYQPTASHSDDRLYTRQCPQSMQCPGAHQQGRDKQIHDSYCSCVTQNPHTAKCPNPLETAQSNGNNGHMFDESVVLSAERLHQTSDPHKAEVQVWPQYRGLLTTTQDLVAQSSGSVNKPENSVQQINWNSENHQDESSIQFWSSHYQKDDSETRPMDAIVGDEVLLHEAQDVSVSSSLDTNINIKIGKKIPDTPPCTECGCSTRGRCSAKASAPANSGESQGIIIVDQEIYHLQGDNSLGAINASNVKNIMSQGDVMFVEIRTEDGREMTLKAVRATADGANLVETEHAPQEVSASQEKSAEEPPVEMNDVNLTMLSMKAAAEDQTTKEQPDKNNDEQSPFEAFQSLSDSTQEAERSLISVEDSMLIGLADLFPELFAESVVSHELGGHSSISWQLEDTEGSESFVEISRNTDYYEALSNCRGLKTLEGSMLLRCGCCDFDTDALDQLQLHVRKHVASSFQCKQCPYTCSMRDEMNSHAVTEHVQDDDLIF